MRQRWMIPLVLLVVLTTACGGDSDAGGGVASLETGAATTEPPTGADAAAASEADREQAMLDFAACMRDNGVAIEDPTVDANGNIEFGRFRAAAEDGQVDRAELDAAFAECQQHIEGIALGRGGGDFDRTELEDTMIEYAACMREHAYDMPDPDFASFGPGADGEPGQGGGPFGSVDFDDPDFLDAQEECQDILGEFGGPGQGGARRDSGGSG